MLAPAAGRHRPARSAARRPGGRHRPAGTRSPTPATGPEDRCRAMSGRRPAGPAGCRASAPARQPVRRAARRPATTPSARVICASSSAARSAANGSAVSSTACTSVPNLAPIGRSAIGDGTCSPAAAGVARPGRRRPRRRARRPPVRWSPRACRTRRADQAGVRRAPPGGVDLPVEVPDSEIVWRSRAVRRSRGGATTDSSSDRTARVGPRRSSAIASASLIRGGSQRSGTTRSPGRRPRSSRDSPPLGSSLDGAHHATTCDCARVSAT